MEIGPTAHKFAQPRSKASKAWVEIGPTAHKFVQPRSKAWVETEGPKVRLPTTVNPRAINWTDRYRIVHMS